jgi:peptidyl-prolyl cis-trans isomerase SurA
MNKVRYIFLVVWIMNLAPLQAQQLVDKILAVVGDNIILKSDVEIQYQQMLAQKQITEGDEARCQLLDQQMLDKLFLAQAQIDSVQASADEIDAELDRRVKYFISMFGSSEKLEEYYGKSIIELKDEFRIDIENQLVVDKMKGKVFSGLKVSPAEVKEFFSNIPADSVPFFNSELELGEIIMLPKVNEVQKEYTRQKLRKIRDDIQAGSDFSLQAILYSEDPGSAGDGGNLGVINRGELVPEFEAVAFRLNPGEVSDLVETPFGFHLIRVEEKRGEKIKVSHILLRPKTVSSDLTSVKSLMDSILHQLRVDSISFRDAVKQFSEEGPSKSNGGMMTNPVNGTNLFEKADIDGTLIFTLDQMKPGEFSEVLPYSAQDKSGELKQGYRIVYLKSETSPHRASLEEDYPKIQIAAKQAKQQNILEKWVKLHRDKTYIRLDDSVRSCPQVTKWIQP